MRFKGHNDAKSSDGSRQYEGKRYRNEMPFADLDAYDFR